MKPKLSLLFAAASAALFLTQCRKTDFHTSPANAVALTPEQQKTKKILDQTMFITAAVFEDTTIHRQFIEAIAAKIKNKPWEEEAITFKELFDVSSKAKFRGLAQGFSRKFIELYYSGDYPNAATFPKPQENHLTGARGGELSSVTPISPTEDLFQFDDGRQVYFPYSEDLSSLVAGQNYQNEISSYSNHPLTNEDVNSGYKYIKTMVCEDPTDKSTCSLQWTTSPIATVNDDYTYTKPTYIINFADKIEPGSFFMDPPPTPLAGTYVSAGWFRATQSEDGLFEGRQEYNILRSDFNVTVSNGQVVIANESVKKPDIQIWFRRSKLRKMKRNTDPTNSDAFITVGTGWDNNWNSSELIKKYVLYSWDRVKIEDSVGFDFTYAASALGLGSGSIKANLKFAIPGGTSRIIYQDDWDRGNFYRLAKTANPAPPALLTSGIKDGWRCWGLGSNYTAAMIYE